MCGPLRVPSSASSSGITPSWPGSRGGRACGQREREQHHLSDDDEMDVTEALHDSAASAPVVHRWPRRHSRRFARPSGVTDRATAPRALRPAGHTWRDRCRIRVGGVCSHLTAALQWEWAVARPPQRPVVTVPRWRRLTPERRDGIDVRWANLAPDDIYRDKLTDPVRTALDCAATPSGEALAVLDVRTAVRHRSRRELLEAARGPPGTRRAIGLSRRRTGGRPTPSSRHPPVAREVPGLQVRPQQPGAAVADRDLFDERLGIVIGCDSRRAPRRVVTCPRRERTAPLHSAGWSSSVSSGNTPCSTATTWPGSSRASFPTRGRLLALGGYWPTFPAQQGSRAG